MHEDNMKPFNTGITKLLGPSGTTMLTQEHHLEPPVTGDRLLTRHGTYFQLTKQDSAREKRFVSTMTSCHGPYTTDIRMWYRYVTINYATHGIYVHPYYCFRPEENNSKVFSAGNDKNTSKF